MANLLLVDDDLEMADICADVLRAEGHVVRLARDGREGIARVEEEVPDLIVCDVEMPVLDGPDMAFSIFMSNAGKERIPILLSSAVRDLRSVAQRVGTPYYLPKPFSVEQLVHKLDLALTERAPPRPRNVPDP